MSLYFQMLLKNNAEAKTYLMHVKDFPFLLEVSFLNGMEEIEIFPREFNKTGFVKCLFNVLGSFYFFYRQSPLFPLLIHSMHFLYLFLLRKCEERQSEKYHTAVFLKYPRNLNNIWEHLKKHCLLWCDILETGMHHK